MNFTLRWKSKAVEHMAALWMNAKDRKAITAAANAIEKQLARDPFHNSESRDKGRRIMIEPPLGVIFKVHRKKRIVDILRVWQFGKRPKK